MSSFAALGVPESLCAALARRGIDEPFPIQAATLPDALAGRDVAGKAPTGSGKTLAFGLAVSARVTGGRPKPRRPHALVLVPTRELAAQVQRELAQLIPRDAGSVISVYGGVGYGPQRSALVAGASTVVACPGRLEDLIASGDVVLDRVQVAVVDEADRMADMGFLPAVKRILDGTPDGRQTLLFSATLDGDVDALVRRYQQRPGAPRGRGHRRRTPATSATCSGACPAASARSVAAQVVDRTGPTVVFCRTTHGADRVTRQLAKEGVSAEAIHGRRSQAQRQRALAALHQGQGPRAGGHRRRRPRHPRRRRGRGRPLRPARRPQGLRAPLGPYRPRRGRRPGGVAGERGRRRSRRPQAPEGRGRRLAHRRPRRDTARRGRAPGAGPPTRDRRRRG